MLETLAKYLGNYLVVQLCIVLFILPFYFFYRRRHQAGKLKIGFNQHLEYFFTSTQANWLVFFWAMGEALVWFVIPEFLLLLVIFMRLKWRIQLLLYDIYGTVAGTFVAFMFHLPERLIDRLPYVQPNMIEQVRHWYDEHGIFGLVFQPFSGVPYKVFTNLAVDYHFFILFFLVVAVLVRISRYYIFYAILSSIYPFFHKRVHRNYMPLFLIATFIFSVLLLKVYNSFGPGYHIG